LPGTTSTIQLASEANRPLAGIETAIAKPFITAFSDSDPVTSGANSYYANTVDNRFPRGCQDSPLLSFNKGGHFFTQKNKLQPSIRAAGLLIQSKPNFG